MKYGSDLHLNYNYIAMYNKLFNHTFTAKCCKSLYYEIFNLLKIKSSVNNGFSKYVLDMSKTTYTYV